MCKQIRQAKTIQKGTKLPHHVNLFSVIIQISWKGNQPHRAPVFSPCPPFIVGYFSFTKFIPIHTPPNPVPKSIIHNRQSTNQPPGPVRGCGERITTHTYCCWWVAIQLASSRCLLLLWSVWNVKPAGFRWYVWVCLPAGLPSNGTQERAFVPGDSNKPRKPRGFVNYQASPCRLPRTEEWLLVRLRR